jgi:hypothetical protein
MELYMKSSLDNGGRTHNLSNVSLLPCYSSTNHFLLLFCLIKQTIVECYYMYVY